ncbi:MAG: hypothetical protein SFW62_07260 [Alphaproteobacteria bacterium]|nr:hypothetical protein [Alphaproteobacteria bacterium]
MKIKELLTSTKLAAFATAATLLLAPQSSRAQWTKEVSVPSALGAIMSPPVSVRRSVAFAVNHPTYQQVVVTTRNGAVTSTSIPATVSEKNKGPAVTDIADGPGGIWFTQFHLDKVGRASRSGNVVKYALPENSRPTGLTEGPKHDMFVVLQGSDSIARLKRGVVVAEYSVPTPDSGLVHIASGAGPSRDNLFFTEWRAGQIGILNAKTNTISEYALPAGLHTPTDITVDPKTGNAWFRVEGDAQIAMITPTGNITGFVISPEGYSASGIAVTRDGAVCAPVPEAHVIACMQRDGSPLADIRIPSDGCLSGVAAFKGPQHSRRPDIAVIENCAARVGLAPVPTP